MYSRDKLFSLSVPTVDLRYVLSHLREEKEGSADAVVTGGVQPICKSV